MKQVFGFPKNVFVLGVVSLFMDISSEMIYPLIPIFLSDVLHASKIYIGIIEGVAESTASILKVFSGWFSDKIGRRKPLIFWGYGISVLSRPLLAGALSWTHVLVYRFTDRVGKGVRTAPRDAVIADSTEKEALGKAFGFHRAMDTTGAVIGPMVAFFMLLVLGHDMRAVFWVSIIPGLLALLTIWVFVKESSKARTHERPKLTFRGLDRRFKQFLVVACIFVLGRTSDAFLVLRARDLGMTLHVVPVLYLVFNTVSAALSTPMGIIADKVGKRRVILASYILFALVFLGFAQARTEAHIWGLFALYGVFVAINEGVQRAFVATVIDPEIKATGYGIYHMAIGLAALPSSIIGGALWQGIGPEALFYYGAAMAFSSAGLFALLLMKDK